MPVLPLPTKRDLNRAAWALYDVALWLEQYLEENNGQEFRLADGRSLQQDLRSALRVAHGMNDGVA